MLRESNHRLGPGDPSHSNRNSGQVSFLLDKNRKEGVCPPLLWLSTQLPLPKKEQESNTERGQRAGADSWV